VYSCLYQKKISWAETEVLRGKLHTNYNIFKTTQSNPPPQPPPKKPKNIQHIQYILLYAWFNGASFHQIPATVTSGTSVTHKTPDNKLRTVFEKS
jgi:hypothetical protein